MGEKLVIGPFTKGLRTDRTPFAIDNENFPFLVNAYQWRGRIKRKRGTTLLGRLQRNVSISIALTLNSGQDAILPNIPIVPGSINLVGSIDGTTYTDPNGNGILIATGGTGSGGTINYASGLIHIASGGGETLTGTISYYPTLPVMGLEDWFTTSQSTPGCIAFDTTYSYNVSTNNPFSIHDVTFFKNPAASASLPGYVPKSTLTPFTWNGQDYQQFYSVNYQGALWVTNGITVPFNSTNIGMQFAPASSITFVSSTVNTITVRITNSPLVIGDFVFLNEWGGTNASTLNFLTGYITAASGGNPNTVTITFPPPASLGAGPYTPGIIQYLTNVSDSTKDVIRWFDGDPTLSAGGLVGWVNFAPPISHASFSISDLPAAQYYLIGARTIVSYKDRLLFFGVVVQTSSGSPIYLQDTVIYSQNGTPYYTSSFTGDPTLFGTVFTPVLVPVNQTATANAYYSDVTGYGGFITAGIDQPSSSTDPNQDVIIVGFYSKEAKVIYTGNDIVPFNFYIINSELGTSSVFSSIVMDKGIISKGSRGIIITDQQEASRIDLEIPDQVFQFSLQNNGTERVCSQRDFINEWIYFTYPSNEVPQYKFPNQTLQYNYRDESWAIFNECYTTYGQFRRSSGNTWLTTGYSSWDSWSEPWNAGVTTLFQPQVIGGNQQGFILFRDEGTNEGSSLYISSISGSTITSPNHSLNNGDYILITGALGTIGAQINGKIFSVQNASYSANTFTLDPTIGSGTYLGSGLITRMYVPQIQTKQFPTAWGIARKTRIGPQQYLLTKTPNGQITLQIFLSQDDDNPYNAGTIVPAVNPEPVNNTLIYTQVLYTCPESTNLGLTPANINLQTPTAASQNQIWHRKNTSLIGDTVQIGFTMSDAQMRSFIPTLQVSNITGITNAYPCVITTNNAFGANGMVEIDGVVGTTQLNGNIYQIISATASSITINVDSSAFGVYISGGTVTAMEMPNQFEEIELHGTILDVNPSQLLV